jgi:hypothetical protein
MAIYIVTEDKEDGALLERILAPELASSPSLQVKAAGSASAVVSYSRTLLRNPENRVIAFSDADGINPEPRHRFITTMLSEISEDRWYAFVVSPSTKSILFENPDLARKSFHKDITDIALVQGKYEPEKALSELFGKDSAFWKNIDPKPLRKTETIKKLLQTIQIFQTEEKLSEMAIAA